MPKIKLPTSTDLLYQKIEQFINGFPDFKNQIYLDSKIY